jgi:hypothetical protein
MRFRDVVAVSAIGAALLAGDQPAAAAVALRVVAVTGEQAPGAPAGVTVAAFNRFSFNRLGQVAFSASLSDSAAYSAFLTDTSGAVHLIAKAGDPAPGLPSGQPLISVGTLALNNRGDFAFTGTATTGDVRFNPQNQGGLWASDGRGGISLLGGAGQGVPGYPGSGLYGQVFLNDAGTVGIDATIMDFGGSILYGSGLWATDASGVLAPLGADYGAQPWLGAASPIMNQLGEFAFFDGAIDLYGPRPDGTLGLILKNLSPVGMGATGKIDFYDPYAVALNDLGETAYRAGIIPNDPPLIATGIVVGPGTDGTPAIRVSETTQLPGAPTPDESQGFDNPLLNNAGDLLVIEPFQGLVIGFLQWTRQGYWLLDRSGNVTPLVVVTGPAPAEFAGETVLDVGPPALNNVGETVFMESVGTLPVVVGSNEITLPVATDVALLAFNRNGQSSVLIRQGDSVTVGPGDTRIVKDFGGPTQAGKWTAPLLNDAGNVAFEATFYDGSSALLVATIPQCADGIDNDGDGLVDWPADPDCLGPNDDAEYKPAHCGLGAELAAVLPLVMGLRSRVRRRLHASQAA